MKEISNIKWSTTTTTIKLERTTREARDSNGDDIESSYWAQTPMKSLLLLASKIATCNQKVREPKQEKRITCGT